jgi:hypothetical protein
VADPELNGEDAGKKVIDVSLPETVNIPSPLMKVEDVRTLARKGAVY